MNINDFGPFEAETWGSISDWFMVCVTAVTGFLIWRTLKSQLKMQLLQQTITEIERHRFRESIKPKFKLSIKRTDLFEVHETVRIEAEFTIFAVDHVAFMVEVTIIKNGEFDFNPANSYPRLYNKITPGMNPILKGTIEKKHKEDDKKYLLNFDVVIRYQDLYKNRYQQIIKCVINEGPGIILPAEPFLIDQTI